MGYETNAIFVSSRNDFKGYCRVEATLDMGTIAGGHIQALMNKVTERDPVLKAQVNDWEEQYKHCWNGEGDYSLELQKMDEVDKNKETDKLLAMGNKLDTKLPYIFHNSENNHSYTDSYGDIMMLVDLKDFRRAVIKEQAEEIHKGNYDTGYRRYEMVIRMIDMFDEKIWGEEPVKIILWGY